MNVGSILRRRSRRRLSFSDDNILVRSETLFETDLHSSRELAVRCEETFARNYYETGTTSSKETDDVFSDGGDSCDQTRDKNEYRDSSNSFQSFGTHSDISSYDSDEGKTPSHTDILTKEYAVLGTRWSSDSEENERGLKRDLDWKIQGAPAAVIPSTAKSVDRVGCKIWQYAEMKKVKLSVLDITSTIVSQVESLPYNSAYPIFGITMSFVLCIIPTLYRLFIYESQQSNHHNTSACYQSVLLGESEFSSFVIIASAVNRFILAATFFFLLSVAERIFKQRFLCAKRFSYLTSARRARKYDLPHFRLNKVLNIKSWLSIRSCLKKRGPQRSVDLIVSVTFILTLVLVFYLGVDTIKSEERSSHPLHYYELSAWFFTLGIYLIRFLTLGTQINKKYSDPSVLITEQINIYFQMEENPTKKDNLMLANNVLKLVSVLLKELDSPYKISGLSANALLYNLTKFGILSACSGVASNMLGFKLKLYNMKLR